MPITLPRSEVSLDKADADASPLVIGVDVKGGLYWGREPVSTVELRDRLHAEAQRDPNRAVRIDGDSSCRTRTWCTCWTCASSRG